MISVDAATQLADLFNEVHQALKPTAPRDAVLEEMADRMAALVDEHGGCSADEFLDIASKSGLCIQREPT